MRRNIVMWRDVERGHTPTRYVGLFALCGWSHSRVRPSSLNVVWMLFFTAYNKCVTIDLTKCEDKELR
ncbi:hypothetical protein A0H81_10076 [Grifola frondosa]|uniref:Uncharacterized protein n=1 Tax=Grifola frondosa TaxID=5627 RepID=A0A1C7M070_GRIFR|nr:hypothetical protein A0H81_10076 [Grifola frondosa]